MSADAMKPEPRPPPPGFDALRLMGRCKDDAGSRFHAVPKNNWIALCKAEPGKRSAGWSAHAGTVVTCSRCLLALAKLSEMATMPWDDCKVAFGVDDGPGIWEALDQPKNEARLPAGWEIDELDGAGARWVMIFRVVGLPSPEDGRKVAALLKDLETKTT